MNKSIIGFSLVACTLVSACGTFTPNGKGDELRSRAEPLKPTQTSTDLSSLPSPRGKITAAVYEFKDKTGQYRPSPSNALSTSVTQGADAIMIEALLDSQWFIPVERAGLQNLLTERKITQSAAASPDAASNLTPVSPAQIIIQGTIVSYDSNTHTGGTGARLLGLGTSQSFREDKVTVNLRLIDIDDGLVLHSVSASKKIFSRQLNTGLFSYIDVDQILELEAGNSYNEPSHIAITEAIESALINLIGEGVLRNTWQLADESDIESAVFERFITAKQREEFTESVIAAAERNAFVEKVRLRINRAKSGVKNHLAEQAEAAERKSIAHAKAQAKIRKKNQQALTSLEQTQVNPSQIQTNRPTQQLVQTSNGAQQHLVNKNVQIVDPLQTEKLITDQAQAILNAQANIQIQATKQAHQAALYAQQLIQQKQAQQQQQQQQQQQKQQQQQQQDQQQDQEQQTSQRDVPTQNNKLKVLENQQGSATQSLPTHEKGSGSKLVHSVSTYSPPNKQ